MAEKNRGEAGKTELTEDDLGKVQGGLLAHELTHLKGKKTLKPGEKGSGGSSDDGRNT